MTQTILEIFQESITITLYVLLMMIAVDIINVKTRGKFAAIMQSAKKWKQYTVSSFLGATPGCVGSFAVVSLYMHGMISFGALTGSMIATSGDEAFVMLVMFPETAIILFVILLVIGLFSSKIIDFIVKKFNIPTCQDCEIQQYHKNEHGIKHYLKEHVWNHLIKNHIWKTFLWTFGALFLVQFALHYFHIEKISSEYLLLVLFISALIGLIPESGPNLIIVTMFASGLIPFSILLTNSIVQDGHGLLPLLSFSVKDSILVKVFNLVLGLLIGLIVFSFGF